MPCNRRSHRDDKPVQDDEESPPFTATREKPLQQWRRRTAKEKLNEAEKILSQTCRASTEPGPVTAEPVLLLENSFSSICSSTLLRGLPDREKELNGQSTPLKPEFLETLRMF